MRNLRISLLIIAAATALTGIIWLGYNLYTRIGPPSESPFNAIPGNTALIIKLNKAGNLLEELNRSNLLWKSISHFPGINSIRSELQFIDSASRKNEKFRKSFQQSNLLISITLSGRNTFGALYLASTGGKNPEDNILGFMKEIGESKAIITETPYFTTRLHRIQFKGSRNPFYFAVLKGILLVSYQPDLVKKGIDRLSLNTPLAASSGFRLVEATSGKKADANIYVNYRFFSLVLSKITHIESVPDLIKFAFFADWSGLDLIIKKDELLFNGITVTSDSTQHFLSLFTEQKPQKTEIATIIPEEALYFTVYGWSNSSRFTQRFQNKAPREESFTGYQSPATRLSRQYLISVNDYFLPWADREGGIFVINDSKNSTEIPYAAIHCGDEKSALSHLGKLAKITGIKMDSGLYKGQRFYKMALSGFLPAIFGEMFSKVDPKCFTILNGYLIFGSSPKDLEPVIEAWQKNTTLAKDPIYIDFAADLNEKSNVYCFFNTRNAIQHLNAILSPDLASQLNPVMDSIKKFESVAFQYSNMDGLFYSNIVLRYDPNLGKEGPLEWQARLDTNITGRPRIIQTAPSRPPVVMVTDEANNLYMINADGSIAWKLHLMGDLKGEIHPLHLPGNDSLFLIFNTGTHLYLVKENGQFADKYPMRFPLNATNGITVVDHGKGREFSILVAFQDHRAYHFTLDGISITNWDRPNLKEEIDQPIDYLRIRGHDYFFITGEQGHVLIADETGANQITSGLKFLHAKGSGFYLNRTNKKGLFLTTNPDGKVLIIQENGIFTEVGLNLYSKEYRFFYEDISGSGQPELIFTDKNRIDYYQRTFELLYSYSFRREITMPPFLIRVPGEKVMIGVVTPETNELFLFDQNGKRELKSGIRGNTAFDIGYLQNPTLKSLVVGSGKYLRNYRLPELQDRPR
ncbi:MAG: hypothetical protein M0P58_00820 [Bacteroidales bacterium]|nr:hypothetical protein [Bacteroidales bacterium]